jgi:hypothetical protein
MGGIDHPEDYPNRRNRRLYFSVERLIRNKEKPDI